MVSPIIQVVVVSADEQRVWFRADQCAPDREVLEGLSEDLFLRTAGAYSLGLDDLDLGMIRLRMNPTFTAEQIGMTPGNAIDEIEDLLVKSAVSGPIADAETADE